MKVLVTGGAGYIGSVCVQELILAGHEVDIIDNLSEGFREAVAPEARLHVGCLSQKDWVLELMGSIQPEAVIHFAALAKVEESMAQPERYFVNNVSWGLHLLNACVAHKVHKIVFSSTCATYGMPKRTPMDENHVQAPINPYGESKLAFERILNWYQSIRKLKRVIFRYFNACGAMPNRGQSHREMSHLIPNILKVVLGQRESVNIFGTDYPTRDGTSIRDYIHIQDLAMAHIKAIECDVTGAFNLGTGKGHSVKEVIQAAERVTGKTIAAIEKPRRDGDPSELFADPRKAEQLLGWKAQHTDLEAIIESAWNWHVSHPNGYPSASQPAPQI